MNLLFYMLSSRPLRLKSVLMSGRQRAVMQNKNVFKKKGVESTDICVKLKGGKTILK